MQTASGFPLLSFPTEHPLGFANLLFGVAGPLSQPISLQHCFSLVSESNLVPVVSASVDIPGQPQILPCSCTTWFTQVLGHL